jgi:hypothetical protein
MYRIVSANGTSSGANQDIVPTMKTFTLLNGTDTKLKIKALYLECDTATNIKVNEDGNTVLRQDPSTGKYTINFENYDVLVGILKIETTGTVWRATFLY